MQILSGNPPSASAVPEAGQSLASRRVFFRPDWHGPRTTFRHTWEGVVNVDQFRWLVRRDLQKQLTLARNELAARDVRAVGRFDDELRVFCPSPASFMGHEPQEPRTNWQTIDYIMDSLLDRGLRPMFTTSFVPSAMTSGPVTVFSTKAHTSPPRDWQAWEAFVGESVRHAIDRYSPAVVREWLFEVWNEPNLHGWFWGGTRAEFHQLWTTTYRAIKSVDASLRVGGPSSARADWIEELVGFGRAHDCVPDYLITHIYNNDSTDDNPLAPFDGPQDDKTSQSPNSAIGYIRGVRALAERIGFKGEIPWNEWGRSFHAVDIRREQPSEAAFIARLLAEVSQEADAFSYWCLSDIYDQVGYGREAFFGGYGLLSLQGLRKPAYHAFQLLAQLEDERVATTGEGADPFLNVIVTTGKKARAHALVYAYDHADKPERRAIEVSLELPAGARSGALYRIDSRENNVLARWRELGAPAYLSREQTRELAAGNSLQCSSQSVRCTAVDGCPVAQFTMESPGVALLEIELPAPLT